MLTVGDKFPQFKLNANVSREKGKEFKEVSSRDVAGKWLVFYAYPKDFTFICPTEIVEFGKRTEVYNGVDFTFRARFGRGGRVQGTLSTGRTASCTKMPASRFASPSSPIRKGRSATSAPTI